MCMLEMGEAITLFYTIYRYNLFIRWICERYRIANLAETLMSQNIASELSNYILIFLFSLLRFFMLMTPLLTSITSLCVLEYPLKQYL